MKEVLKTQILETLPENLLSGFFKALSEPTRIKIVQILLEGERNVLDLMEILGIPQANVSNHLGCLKWCGFVIPRRYGKNIYYRILDERIPKVLKLATEIIAENAEYIHACTRLRSKGDLRYGTKGIG
jgi:DNA-binding transcriptional ArsR family regulator